MGNFVGTLFTSIDDTIFILKTIFLFRQVLFEMKMNELKIQAKLFETVSLLLKPVDFQDTIFVFG